MRTLLPIALACLCTSACAPAVVAPTPPPWSPYTGTLHEYAGRTEEIPGLTERVLTRLAGGDVDGAANLLDTTPTDRREPPAVTVLRARSGDLGAIIDLMRTAHDPSVEQPWLLLAAAEGLMETYPRAAAHLVQPLTGDTSPAGLVARSLTLKALVAGERTTTATELLASWLGDPANRLKDVSESLVRRLPAQDLMEAETERGWLLLDAKEKDRAAGAFARAIAMADSSTDHRCWALAGDATAKLYQQRRNEGRKALSRALNACPQHETSPRLEVVMARVAFTGEDEATFQEAVARVEARGHAHAVRNGIHTLPVIRRAEGDLAEVRGLMKRRYRAWPFSDSTADLAMRVWHDLDRARSHSRAAAVLAPLVDAEYSRDRTSLRGQLDYWMATSLGEMGHAEAAKIAHGRNVLRHPLTWYGLMSLRFIQETDPEAAEELRALVPQPGPEAEPTPEWEHLPGGPALKRELEVLAWWGLSDAIMAVTHTHDLHTHVGRSLWVSRLLESIGAHEEGARVAQRTLNVLGLRSPTNGPVALWRAAFPQPYEGRVLTSAEKRQVEPELIWAMMRVESYYNTVALSRAGARGLMQVMPSTARYLLWASGRAGATVDLFDPPSNIEMSADLLARLSHRFDERKPLMIAAYNAGSGRVKRWLDETSSLQVDRFVEKIPIAQARHYVRSVTGAWASYQYLSGCHCVADLSDDLRRLAGP